MRIHIFISLKKLIYIVSRDACMYRETRDKSIMEVQTKQDFRLKNWLIFGLHAEKPMYNPSAQIAPSRNHHRRVALLSALTLLFNHSKIIIKQK